MSGSAVYTIGIPGQKWGKKEKETWLSKQSIKRSYQDEVVTKIEKLKNQFDIATYGAISYDENKYPLYVITSLNWDETKPTVLITGGVHGYETSGVHGALGFVSSQALNYTNQFNLIITPCISPWGYETINRWNPNADDPNRSFYENSPAAESAALMKYIASLNTKITAHIDLHETTDTDNTQFRPALAARDATVHDNWNIPDGFYLVGDTLNPAPDFQGAIINKVKSITHIAPADGQGKIIGSPLEQEGVINYPTSKLSLCIGFTQATYSTTTEVYPDSDNVTDEECINAQITAITAGLDYISEKNNHI
ncbi:M14 family metallopeptidase [Pseudoalteromonas denitrificans]|uniref:Succinylglutamate desuccinylase / Aspartoacylase family protein n=1 Tax=Pseudoalteromonas denitrificans DSM 6059 TaxID=1123010 RepID=A0A1I1RF72_9GAMM|nr:M14 family metallocarboxypeptidase [Pseudoalteromonas denitrificans]SFD33036.1 Succinylglutamate desuccinylase / Aspartoacylase family protein [Pseudoalteromonas denitrificans DSM 6059]